MNAFDLNPNLRWLFCMTHPDDEISVCAWIKRLTDAGAEVYLSWTHDTSVRQDEGRRAAEKLGVPTERLRFYGKPDGHVVDHIIDLREPFREMMEEIAPDRVCCGAFEQGHLDHDATNYLVTTSFDGPVFEIPFYHAYLSRVQRINRFADPTDEQVLSLSGDEIRFKKDFAKLFPSTNIWSCLFWYEAYQAIQFKPICLAKTERMRLKPDHDFRTPHVPDHLYDRVVDSPRWGRWLAALDKAEAAPKVTRKVEKTLA